MNIAGWDRMYGAGDRGAEDSPTQMLRDLAPGLAHYSASLAAPRIAVDLACGAGRNALYLAELGWKVTAVDGSRAAIDLVNERAASRGLKVTTIVADLMAPDFTLPENTFNLVLVAFYLQRDLFNKAKTATRRGGAIAAIVHNPEPGEPLTEKRAAPGELRRYFADWEVLHDYEGPSRDPAHHRPVAEIVARLPVER